MSRDFGAHNVLIDADIKIVGRIDLDSVMAALVEKVAQFPLCLDLGRQVPDYAETKPAARKRLEMVAKLFPKYVGSVRAVVEREEASSGKKGVYDVADFLLSAAASVVEGLGCVCRESGGA